MSKPVIYSCSDGCVHSFFLYILQLERYTRFGKLGLLLIFLRFQILLDFTPSHHHIGGYIPFQRDYIYIHTEDAGKMAAAQVVTEHTDMVVSGAWTFSVKALLIYEYA